jgi:hypothetical protein
MIGEPDLSAAGSEISATNANTYAHHIEPIDRVILTARRVLSRAIGLSPCTAACPCWVKTNFGMCAFALAIADLSSIITPLWDWIADNYIGKAHIARQMPSGPVEKKELNNSRKDGFGRAFMWAI